MTLKFGVVHIVHIRTGTELDFRKKFLDLEHFKAGSNQPPGTAPLLLRLRKAQMHLSLEKPSTHLIGLFSSNREHAKMYLIYQI